MNIPAVLKDMLALPTASFVEDAVMNFLTSAAAALPNTSTKIDVHGNLLVHYEKRADGETPPPVCLTAHTDHPGFVSLSMKDDRTVVAAFRGWVEPEYFKDEKVRFWVNGEWVKGRVQKVTKVAPIAGAAGRTGRPEEVEIRVKSAVPANSPGMWNLPEPELRDGRVYARACDDIAGAAALLAMFQRLAETNAAASVYGLFTRAEEVGFIGAIGAARSGTIPRNTPVVAIETSKEIPGVKMGDGPILRVGDRMSVFTPEVTAFVERVAKALVQKTAPAPKKSRKDAITSEAKSPRAAKTPRHPAGPFRFQRKLMDGGTCESTAYLAYGYPTTGICIALGNYHNMNAKRVKIASEYVSINDWLWMVDWFVALAVNAVEFVGGANELREKLDKRFAECEELLTAGRL